MARFIYLGEPARQGLKYGPTLAIVFHLKDGSRPRVDAPNQTTGFVIGQDLGIEITEKRVLRHMRADKRFREITSSAAKSAPAHHTI